MFYKGEDGAMLVDGNPIAQVKSYSYEETVNEIATNVLGASHTDMCGGQISLSGSVTLLFDAEAVSGSFHTTVAAGAEIDLEFMPGGDTTGLFKISGNALVGSVTSSVSIGDAVELELSWSNKGAWVRSAI